MLRVRDTGHGLNDNEVAAAMEPFRTPPPSDKATDSCAGQPVPDQGAGRSQPREIRHQTGGRSGTLIEVVFPQAVVRA